MLTLDKMHRAAAAGDPLALAKAARAVVAELEPRVTAMEIDARSPAPTVFRTVEKADDGRMHDLYTELDPGGRLIALAGMRAR